VNLRLWRWRWKVADDAPRPCLLNRVTTIDGESKYSLTGSADVKPFLDGMLRYRISRGGIPSASETS
jgi:hypothetical protein